MCAGAILRDFQLVLIVEHCVHAVIRIIAAVFVWTDNIFQSCANSLERFVFGHPFDHILYHTAFLLLIVD